MTTALERCAEAQRGILEAEIDRFEEGCASVATAGFC
jgi:hypothetical protein